MIFLCSCYGDRTCDLFFCAVTRSPSSFIYSLVFIVLTHTHFDVRLPTVVRLICFAAHRQQRGSSSSFLSAFCRIGQKANQILQVDFVCVRVRRRFNRSHQNILSSDCNTVDFFFFSFFNGSLFSGMQCAVFSGGLIYKKHFLLRQQAFLTIIAICDLEFMNPDLDETSGVSCCDLFRL